MFELTGKYNKAKVFTDNIDQKTISQIIELLNQEFAANSKIRIMPDAHAGIGCVIGTTMEITNKICPNLVGVDIGCGMEVVKLREREIDLECLDKIIHEYIPAGADIREKAHPCTGLTGIESLCYHNFDTNFAGRYLGTLGGGNHFIEIDKSSTGDLYLIIHSGSRTIGKRVAEYYQKCAYQQMRQTDHKAIHEYAKSLRDMGLTTEIPELLNARRNQKTPTINPGLAYVTGYLLDEYLHDMEIMQDFADKNRQAIACEILKRANLTQANRFSTIHNYIDVKSRILRKGAVSAKAYEKFIIPLNMRDGSLICRGKGNPDWNQSAPHGAGRILSRSKAKQQITMEEYQEAMKNVYSTSVAPDTLDESPMAYKTPESIIANITDTCEILDYLTPIYNFKAGRNFNPI